MPKVTNVITKGDVGLFLFLNIIGVYVAIRLMEHYNIPLDVTPVPEDVSQILYVCLP